MKKVFLKRNLNKKIAEIEKNHPDVKVFDYKKDIDWEEIKSQGINCIVNENRWIDEIYKIKEDVDINNLEMLYGNKTNEDGKISICSKEISTPLGETINHSSILITKNLSLQKNNIIHIKLNRDNEENYVYFRFFNKKQYAFLKERYIENSLIDTSIYLDIYIGNNKIGYALKKGNEVLFNYKLDDVKNTILDIVFDFYTGNIIINNKKICISKHIINKYIKNNKLLILTDSIDKHEYELSNVTFGIKNVNVEDILIKKGKDILCFKDDLYFYRKEKSK